MLEKFLKTVQTEKLTKDEQKSILGGNAPVCNEGNVAKRCTEFGTAPAIWECVPIGTTAC